MTHFPRRVALGWNERPMLFPLRARRDPSLESIYFLSRQRLALGRHAFGLVRCAHACDHCALINVTRHNRVLARIKLRERRGRVIEPKATLVDGRPMTTEAAASQER